MPGYFLFAPPPSDSPEKESAFNLPTLPTPSSPEHPDDAASFQEQLHDLAGQEKSRKSKEARRARLAREREEAYQGELAWVRSGGRVRDAKGRVDRARTELLRAEIRLQDEEKRIPDAWNAYEARWRALSSSSRIACITCIYFSLTVTIFANRSLSSGVSFLSALPQPAITANDRDAINNLKFSFMRLQIYKSCLISSNPCTLTLALIPAAITAIKVTVKKTSITLLKCRSTG